MTSWCNKVDAVRLQVEFSFTKGSEVRDIKIIETGIKQNRDMDKDIYIETIIEMGNI